MAITSGPLTSTPPATAPGAQNPLALQAIGTPNVNPADLQMNPQGVINTLANNAPQSLSSLLMPLYSQLFNTQSGALAGQRDRAASSGVAQAQSTAMKRGMTGSSIEMGGMQGAESQAQDSYMQSYANLLGQYVQQYAGAAGADVHNQQGYYGNLAQALGQGYADAVQQTQFQKMLDAGAQQSQTNARAQMWSGAFQGMGNAASAFSDTRLKKNLRKIGRKLGLDVYAYEYDDARYPDLRLPKGTYVGFLAHHVADKYPEAVAVVKGYLAVDYVKLEALTCA